MSLRPLSQSVYNGKPQAAKPHEPAMLSISSHCCYGKGMRGVHGSPPKLVVWDEPIPTGMAVGGCCASSPVVVWC